MFVLTCSHRGEPRFRLWNLPKWDEGFFYTVSNSLLRLFLHLYHGDPSGWKMNKRFQGPSHHSLHKQQNNSDGEIHLQDIPSSYPSGWHWHSILQVSCFLLLVSWPLNSYLVNFAFSSLEVYETESRVCSLNKEWVLNFTRISPVLNFSVPLI